ncbi:MAG: efflux RND transporter periplasmic adaptor subunit [Candidatus Aminicenantes bacterium]|nr:efflux RND transporter periplasmic adaptor subunit [Candidatus Aminicenantes bacterium]
MVIPKKAVGISLLILAVAAGGYFFILKKGPAKSADSAGAETAPSGAAAAPGAPGAVDQKTEPAPIQVKAVTAAKGDLIMTLKSPGEAYTEKKIALKAEASGVIKSLAAAEGLHVKAGDVLIEIDDREYALKLERLEAMRLKYLSDLFLEKQFAGAEKAISPAALDKLAKAQAEYEKVSLSFGKGLVAQAELERAQKDYELALIEAGRKKEEIMASTKNLTQAEIDVKLARLDLEKTRIRAPYAGIITDLKVSPQERIDAGRELFTLVDISRIKVKAKVLESEIGKMQAGRTVDLQFAAYPGKTFKGTVDTVSPVVNAEDRTCTVYVSVANSSEELKPGMHAEVEIAADIYKDRLVVPQDAVLIRSGRKLVFVVEGGVAKWRYVEIGLENEKVAEILPSTEPGWGLHPGEQVIVAGHFTLAHDAKVVVKN